jgi:amino acid transporter
VVNAAKQRAGSGFREGTLGTFGGVFTPSILTILGIILFLRLGYVVGNAGLARALIMIAMANAISVLTAVSLSAVATNLKVKGGGDYYLISRTLGLEFGGAIGTVLFLAQSVSIAFYCIGFGEALAGMLPLTGRLLPQIIAAAAVSVLFVFSWLGADWATRFQYVVMAILGVALLSIFVGGVTRWDSGLAAGNWAPPQPAPPFWVLFAIFFPAVTGFTQGVSMSGDLEDPGKSLPRGTFMAVGLSAFIYFAVAILFAGGLPREVLVRDYASMTRLASIGSIIDAGVIAATLSSGMASFLGAPRILQSMARDRIFPFLAPFAKGVGATENPRRGVLLSCGIAFATVALGNLNLIAPIVSMFFLISYGLLNYATFYEARAASPSFRPRFRWFDARLSLVGGLACLGAMLAINVAAGAVAIAVLFSIYQYLKRTAGPARWADSRRSYHLQRVREHLLGAAHEPEHARDWRPQLLVFSDDPERREPLLRFASWLEGPSGLTTVVQILEGEGAKMTRQRDEAEAELRKDLARIHSAAFPLVVAAPNLSVGAHTLVQAYGIGPLRANTILLNWLEQVPGAEKSKSTRSYGRNLRGAFRLGCNILLLDAKEGAWASLAGLPPDKRRIDVWWWGDRTCRLLLLLAYLMTRSEGWRGARIRVLAALTDSGEQETPETEDGYESTVEELRKTLEEVRISAEPEVAVNTNVEAVAEQSANAALVFLPFRLKGDQLVGPFGGRVEDLLAPLPVAAIGLAAEDISLDAEPEEGKSAEIAAALDAFSEAKKRAEKAEREAAEARAYAGQKLRELQGAASDARDDEVRADVEAAALDVMELADRAARRAAEAAARMETAAKAVEAAGVPPEEAGKTEEAAREVRKDQPAVAGEKDSS